MELQETGDSSSQREIIMSSSHREHTPSLLVSVAVGVLVVINIIITAILLGRPTTTYMPTNNPQACPSVPSQPATQDGGTVVNVGGSTLGGSSGEAAASSDRTYLLAYGHDFGAYEYIDAGGYHRGFFRELAEEVCTAAGVKCKMVFDKYTNCWESLPGKHPTLGTGLQARYFDGCLGWQPTIERIHTASFSLPFTNPTPGHFYVKPGSTFNTDNFDGKKIAFLESYADNEKCLARELSNKQGIPLSSNQAVYGVDPTVLLALLNNGEADAIFATKAALGIYATNGELKQLDNPEINCVLGGFAIMSRADSDLPAAWNRGFMQIVTNGQFKQLCENGQETHAEKGKIECAQSYDWNV